MTYFGFLICFVFIPGLILLVAAVWNGRRGKVTPGFQSSLVWRMIGVHLVLALVYTTPWDNYLVASGVWSYNLALVTGIIFGFVPIEEYTFFLLETLLAVLWWWFLARRLRPPLLTTFQRSPQLVYFSAFFLLAAWIFFTCQLFFGSPAWNYLGLIFFWALPVILLQLLFGADLLWRHRQLLFWAIFPPALYLSLVDIIALKATTWSISPAQTTGVIFFGILPLEEVVFFLMTNVLIGFGLTLMLSDLSQLRFADWRRRGFKGLP